MTCGTSWPQVVVAVGAGHAFKFAGLIGKILSQLAVNGRTDYDIDRSAPTGRRSGAAPAPSRPAAEPETRTHRSPALSTAGSYGHVQ